ncbi:MAG: PocR ligand-binding domain-containing protein [Spirochaetales bacterium]|nr:PocR ligand-binding domain-containing protein [Spirochaetales bacterium]
MADEIRISELLNIDLLQRIQDDFAEISHVGSVIYDLDGAPITRPSNFCGFCRLIRGTEKGLRNCMRSDAELWELAQQHDGGAIFCKSGRLNDGIAPILVEGRRIANWGIGQVLFGEPDEDWTRWYARDIGVPEDLLVSELRKVRIVPEGDFLRTIRFLITLSREISELALANYRLKSEVSSRIKSEQRYSAIVNNAIVGICEIANDGRLEYVNEQMCQMLGLSREELTGRDVSTVLCSERDFQSYFKGIVGYANKAFANVGYDFYGVFRRKNGEQIPCRICLTPQTNLSGQVVRSSAVLIDVSAEKRALEELERKNRDLVESKRQMDMLFDNNVNALCILDSSLRRVKYNPAYRQLVDRIGEAGALEADRIWEPVKPEMLRELLAGTRAECEVKKEYGLTLYSIRVTPTRDDGSSIKQLLVSIRDITNYQLMIENALFAERMSGVGMLASGIAHDIKGIFAVISNSNCTLKRLVSSEADNGTRQKYHEVLGVQEEGLRHGRRLLGQLLSMSGRKNEARESFVLKECVENVVKIYNGEILSKNASVTIRVGDNVVIRGQQSKFIQILMNLLSNALEAIDNNGEIRLFDESSPGRLKLCVEDNGCGIDETERGAIFQAYYTTKRHGTGLGLFLVKNIAEEMGGCLTVESAKGIGARFTMELADNDRVTTVIR